MRLFSSKKICILIAALGILGAGALIVVSAARQNSSRNAFPEEGYIVSIGQDEENVVVNNQNWFAEGTRWSRDGLANVSFKNQAGEKVVVDEDSFIHYGSNSLAATKDAVIADMDQYLEGVIGCYYLPVGNVLTYDAGTFYIVTDGIERRFENFVWKNSSNRYLLGSPTLTIKFPDGEILNSQNGFLEMYYFDDDDTILQLSNGENVWQIISRGCTITLANGVVMDCETRKLLKPDNSSVSEDELTGDGSEDEGIITLNDIDIDVEGSVVLDSAGKVSEPGQAPVFNFTLIDGEDGLDGTSGETGTAGEDGIEGTAGETGEDGSDGEDGTDGTKGNAGEGGAYGVTGANGGVDTGVTVKTGNPVIITPTWELKGTTLNFTLAYEEESYESIDSTQENAYVYIYDVATGEVVWEQTKQTITANPSSVYTFGSLKPDTTYCLTVVDSYSLSGTPYNAKLLERIFTTDTAGIQIGLVGRDENSFNAAILTDSQSYVDIQEVKVTLTDAAGNEIIQTFDNSTKFENFLLGENRLKSNTYYEVSFEVSYNTKDKGDSNTSTLEQKTFRFEWTTLKKRPILGGLSLTSENGYLVARALGAYDAADDAYGVIEDADNALESVRYELYTADQYASEGRVPAAIQTVPKGGTAYFLIDGEIIENHTDYYVVAVYDYHDGDKVVTLPVLETRGADAGKEAYATATAVKNEGVHLSFSGSGTSIYNLAQGDQTEGTTYETIAGSLMVNLNGMTVNVNDVKKLNLTVTDNLTYEKTISYNSCDGKQGNIEGSFALPIDLDGLLMNNAYTFTLSGYVFNMSSETYEYKALGTIVMRTDAEADIQIGIQQASNGGTGVDFWLGAEEKTDAVLLTNYYDQTSGSYLDGSAYNEDNFGQPEKNAATYYANTDASYRNLSSIIFELYKGSSENPDPGDLIGTCEVYGQDVDGNRISFLPGYSPLYQKYYGEAVESCKDNSVGVGESFTHRFVYNPGTTSKTGVIPESDLSTLSDGKFTIKVKTAYDYTYDRYSYEGPDNLYDYYIANSRLDMEDYVNQMSINKGAGKIDSNILYQERPVSPNDVKKNDYAMDVRELKNEDMGAYNGRGSQNELFDESLLADTAVGLELESYFRDTNRMTKTVTFYGIAYEKYEAQWSANETLTDIRDKTYTVTDDSGNDVEKNVVDFKFTFPMTEDGSPIADGTGALREKMPKLRLVMYDKADTTLEGVLDKSGSGYEKTQDGDRGYSFYKYDASEDAYIIYTDAEFLKRGYTYIFAYDAIMDFTLEGNNGVFQYPKDYYDNEWISGRKYARNTALRSQYVSINRQEPAVYAYLENVGTDPVTGKGIDTWNVYLYDPDEAVLPDSLLGFNKDYTVTAGLYDQSGPLYDTDDGFLHIGFTDGDKRLQEISYHEDETNQKMKGVITGVSSGEGEILNGLIQNMHDIDVQGDKITNAGTAITVSGLSPNTSYYSWRVGYRLVTDYLSNSMDGMIPLVEHKYGGTASLDFTDGEITNNAAADTEGKTYTLHSEVDEGTNNLVTVSIDGTGASYRQAMQRIAAVCVTAEVQKAGSNDWKSVYDRDEEGTLLDGTAGTTETPKKQWLAVGTAAGSSYYQFQFAINEFDKSTEAPQFTTRDSLRFTYTFYYAGGEIGYEPNTTYYALKSVNRTEGGSSYYGTFSTSGELSFKNTAARSIYGLSSAPVLERTLSVSNGGDKYMTGMTQIYQSTDTPFTGKDVSRTEYLSFDSDMEKGYWMKDVSEFCRLTEGTSQWNTVVEPIAPSISSIDFEPGLSQAIANVNIDSYGLMQYPEGEKIHLYYALYKESEAEDEYGDEYTELSLVGVMIGEQPRDAEKPDNGFKRIVLDQLEKNTSYRLYVYYKDNRKGDAKKDSEIFGTLPAEADFVTGSQAEALAKKFTPVDADTGKLNPVSNEMVGDSGISKISGLREFIVTPAGVDDYGNPIAAVKDYYEPFTTLKGIVINNLEAKMSFYEPYVNTSNTSGKKITATATTSFKQDENTKLFFVLERCSTDDATNVSANWHTVLADKDYPTDRAVNPYFSSWADENNISGHHYAYYGTDEEDDDDYTYQNLTANESGSTYTAKMSLTFYPGYVLKPGYYYRMRCMIFQFDENGTNPVLVSLANANSTVPYYTRGNYLWKKYEFQESDQLIRVTNMTKEWDGDKQKMTATIRSQQTGTLIDRNYYVRLCKYNENTKTWEVLEDDEYYGNYLSSGTKIHKMGYSENSTYQNLTFHNLEAGATYRLQFYGLMDTEYDNLLNVKDDTGGKLLGKNFFQATSPTGKVYTNLDDHYGTSKVAPTNELKELYQEFLGISESADVKNLNIKARGAKGEAVMIGYSNSVTTFAAGQTGTIGSHYQTDIRSPQSFTLHFDDASGLQNAETCNYTISYMGDVQGVDSISGTLTKASGAVSLMDNGATSGDVALTLTDNRLNLNNTGTYYVQLELLDKDGNRIEKPGTIEFVRD